MPTVIPVKFKYAARDLWFDPMQTEAQEGDHVICSTERGTEIGLATMDAIEMDDERLHATIGDATLKPVLRVADEDDLDRAEELAQLGEDALPTFRRLVAESELDMKPVGVEYLFSGNKVVCYFSAEDRVDFRQLVRDLSHELHERIDMRQIGVREEAAIIGGFAHCGQELCCARFGKQFEPVSIRMAKEQDLPLNSTKISGACGRLMCCLRYEFEAYRDFKSRAPKRNAVIETPLGKGKIVEYDTPKEQICLRLENGKQVRVSLADMEASEAAVKKSEELGCPCRPDTVTRAALDKLESPEIKMALAELDRQMGVVPADSYDESDLFVETRPRRRRRRAQGGDAAAEQPQSQPASTGKRKAQPAPKPAATPDEGAAIAASGGKRRRRRKAQGAAAPAVAPQVTEGTPASEAAAPAARRRRRHHATTEGAEAPATNGAQKSRSPEAPKQERPRGMQPKRRRRPGDKGGAASAQEATPQATKGQKPTRRKPNDQQGQAPARPRPGHAEAAGDDAKPKPKRRRRRRGGRGKGTPGEGAQGGAPTAE